jgi:hypothetical protein
MSIRRFRHPSARDLTGYAVGDVAAGKRSRLAAHLMTCPECRRQVEAVAAVLAEARSRQSSAGDARGWAAAVAQRRAAGERVILPAEPITDSGVGTRRERYLGAAAAACLVIAVVMGGPPAVSGGSAGGELVIHVDADQNAPFGAEYRPGIRLAGEPVLLLRGRYGGVVTGGDEYVSDPLVLARLYRDADGTYRSSFTLPPGTTYAILAVEDTTGSHIDTNLGRYWEYLASDADGRPTLGALRAQWAELQRSSFGRAHAVVRAAAARYPDDPEVRATLAYFDNMLLSGAEADSSMAEHRSRFAMLHGALAAAEGLEAAQLGGMLFWSRQIGDSIAHEYWRVRAVRDAAMPAGW